MGIGPSKRARRRDRPGRNPARGHLVRTAFVCAKCLAKAAVYAVLGATALLFALGLEYEADERFRELTGETLEVPGGVALVLAVAVGMVAVGLYTLVRGLTGGFMKDIDLPTAPDRWEPLIEAVGRVGYVAKGVAFGLVGVLLWRGRPPPPTTPPPPPRAGGGAP